LRKCCDTHSQGNAELGRKVVGGGKMMVALSGRYVMEQAYQFLTNYVLLIEREVFDDAQDDGISEDGGIERMGGVGR
jgi:hypothetical protein